MVNEFVDYLKANQNFERFMQAWKEKYEIYGVLKGLIVIKHAMDMEKQAISLITGKDYYTVIDVKVSYSELMNSLSKTKFADIDFTKVLLEYYDNKLVTKQSIKEQNISDFSKTEQEIINKYKNTTAHFWLCNLQQYDKANYTKLINEYNNNPNNVIYLLDAIIQLPIIGDNGISLAEFSTLVTKDPHYFDKGFTFEFFIKALAFFESSDKPLNLIEKNALLAKVGILKDPNNTYISFYNLQALDYYDQIATGINWFAQKNQAINLNVSNIGYLSNFINIKHVIIIENISVFEAIKHYLIKMNIQDICLVCTGGQLNVAAYLFFDIFKDSSVCFYYCGDFDPEGLLIAQRVFEKLNNKVTFLAYDDIDYELANSNKNISEKRLKSLDTIYLQQLQSIKAKLIKYKKAGYQESIIQKYIEIIKQW